MDDIMMISLLTAAALAMTLQAQPELQPDAQPATPEVEAEATEAEDRRSERVCERRQVTGSGIGRRVCYTRAEADARAEADRQRLESMQGAVTASQPNGFGSPQ
ncbi:MAG: hypothetical protein ACI8U3_001655 [Brevundimonas sp.]